MGNHSTAAYVTVRATANNRIFSVGTGASLTISRLNLTSGRLVLATVGLSLLMVASSMHPLRPSGETGC